MWPSRSKHIYLLISLLLKHAIVEFMSGRNNNGMDYRWKNELESEYEPLSLALTLAQCDHQLTSRLALYLL